MNATRFGVNGEEARRAPVPSHASAGGRAIVAVAFAALTLLASVGAGVFGLGSAAAPARAAVASFPAQPAQTPASPSEAPGAPLRLQAITVAGPPAAPTERRRPLEGPELDQTAAAGSDEAGADPLLRAGAVNLASRPADASRFTPRCARAPPA